jgi:uncharacterized SAM-binding protein YcdF (DUF218 family)
MLSLSNDGWNKKPAGWENIENEYLNMKTINTTSKKFYKEPIDGIFVLAGGIDKDGLCHPFVKDRLDKVYEMYTKANPGRIFCIGGGSYHTPPIINSSHYVIHESTSCAEYLIKKGILPQHIYKECASYDTIANGYYSFTNFIIPLKLTRIALITSEFHMERAKTIFDWMKQLFHYDINILYVSTTNNSLNEKILAIRQERENNSVRNLQKNVIITYNTLEHFHTWFYTEHKAYCAQSELTRNTDITDKLLKQTY